MNYYFKTGIIAAALVFGSAFTVGADETVKKKVEKKQLFLFQQMLL